MISEVALQASPTVEGFSELELIGTGGFSSVYSARQDEFGRSVALKVLKFRLESDAEKQSFESECRAMAQLSDHPHIVSLYSTTYTADGFPVIVMQLFTGGTFNDTEVGDTEQTLSVGVKIASALHFAHQKGIIHRDIKPKNVLLSQFGEPSLTDFGISAIADRAHTKESAGLTLAYASPEALAEETSEQTDIYSLAATLYALLAGHHPHKAVGQPQDLTELARRILYEDPPPLRDAGFSPRFDSLLVRKGLAKEPSQRPTGARAFAEMLQTLQRGENLETTAFIETVDTQAGAPSSSANSPRAASAVGEDPSITIVRKVDAAKPAPAASVELVEDDPGWSPRKLIALGAGATALGLLALVLIFGRSQSEPELVDEPLPAEPSGDIAIYQSQLFAPTNVAMSRQLDGTVVVTWVDPNPEEAEFEIQRLDAAAASEPVQKATGTSHVLEGISDADAPCITMRAIGPSGGISRDIDRPVCLAVEISDGPVIALVPPACTAGACSFRIDASGLLPNSSVSVVVEGPDGQDLNTVFDGIYESRAEVDSRGAIDWRFRPEAGAPVGNYRVVVTDTLSGLSSSAFFEITSP